MVENVQCPVCTLFLHAGMNLSDHLETHPKEQVIKALVQLTITGGGASADGGALKAALLGEKPIKTDKKEQSCSTPAASTAAKTDQCNSRIATISNNSGSTTTGNLSFSNSFGTPQQSASTVESQSSHSNYQQQDELNHNNNNNNNNSNTLKQSYQNRSNSATNEALAISEAFNAMHFNQFHHQQTTPASTSAPTSTHEQQKSLHSQYSTQSQLENFHQKQQMTGLTCKPLGNFIGNTSQQEMPLPPPPPPPPPQIPIQQQQSRQQQQISSTDLSSSTTASVATFPTNSLQQTSYAAAVTQRQHLSTQQQQQTLKIVYSGGVNLPPPPPLQLFSYQHSIQHQKPPPAYGTAISQIRSQQNQNKQNFIPAATANLAALTQQSSSTFPAVQQQQQQPQLQRNLPSNPPRIVSNITTQQQHQHQQQQQQQQSITTSLTTATTTISTSSSSSSSSFYATAAPKRKGSTNNYQQESLLPPPPSSASSQQQQQQASDLSQHAENTRGYGGVAQKPPVMPSAASSSTSSKSSIQKQLNCTPITPSAAVVASSSSSSSSRQVSNHSPFPIILSAAPSPSPSVLRYAESPVAHYLERENGDFIVQETPKHIVECVEEEDGGFSVTERFHQSPPSVLHIHDDNDDDDDNNANENENDEDEVKGRNDENLSAAASASQSNEIDKTVLNIKNPESVASVSGGVATALDFTSRSSNSNSNSNAVDSLLTTKKTSKNTITVLSDVQLNLNEYLDLMGNIIASGKINKRRTACSASAPIPLVKIEKIEPIDEDYDDCNNRHDDETPMDINQKEFSFEDAKKNETERQQQHHHRQQQAILNELRCDENQIKLKEMNATTKGDRKTTTTTINEQHGEHSYHATMPILVPTTLSHVTSVIRMATASSSSSTAATLTKVATTQSQQSPQQQQPQEPLTKNSEAKLIDEITHQKQQFQSSEVSNAVASEIAVPLTPQDLSQSTKNAASTTKDLETPSSSAYAYGVARLPPPPPLRKGPKKLVIKPKTIKTENNAKKPEQHENETENQNQTENETEQQAIILNETNNHSSSSNSNNANNIDSQLPTTSTAAGPQSNKQFQNVVPEVVIKCEPGTYEMNNVVDELEQSSQTSVQQQHHHEHQQQLQQHYQYEILEVAVDYSSIKNENEIEILNSKDSVAEDARVLLDFANSTKRAAVAAAASNVVENELINVTSTTATVTSTTTTSNTGPTSFFSSNSFFSNATPKTNNNEHSNTRIVVDVVNNSLTNGSLDSSASTSTSQHHHHQHQHHQRKSLHCEEEFLPIEDLISVSDTKEFMQQHQQTTQAQMYHQHHHQQQQQQHDNQAHNSFADYPFNFFYGGATTESSSSKQQQHQFSSMYQHQTPDATTTAATVASSSTLDTLDDSTSTPGMADAAAAAAATAETNRFGSVHHHSLPQWYQPATLVAHSDFTAALAIDNAAVGGGGDDEGKYLDLDACKREAVVASSSSRGGGGGLQMAQSSTSSSSFAVVTDSSLAGGCTTDTLNIRTDEKMPPKGEISEQESNCDIENSWSQPVYGEIPSKFYRTTFPGIFPHDGGWNNDEFFTVQDLSPAAQHIGSSTHGNNNKQAKSFEFFNLPLDTSAGSLGGNSLPLANDDVFPSTSMGAKKKRKRDVENGVHHHRPHGSSNRSKPTSTITSQQFMQNEDLQMQHQQQQQPNQRHPKPTTSTAAAAAAAASTTTATSATAAAISNLPTRVRRKVYVCPHCSLEFNKLRDKNLHMIEIHNYVRQNRRLINTQLGIISNDNGVPTSTTTTAAPASSLLPATASIVMPENMEEFIVESKHSIKIKMEFDPQTASAATVSSALNSQENFNSLVDSIDTKSEFIDEKANVLDINVGDAAAAAATLNGQMDTKPNPNLLTQLPLPPTPSTKLATLYRMLISYNVATLKQSQNLTDVEEKLIESSIFFCYTCRTNFSSVKMYDAHLTEHPAECFTCGKKFQRWKNFSLHLKRHLGWKEFGCNTCDKKFVVRSALVEHTRMHTGHTPLKCKVCGKSFKRYSNLTQHRKRHGRLVVRKKEYVCHCGEVLPSKARFLWHKETHDSKPKCCPHCCDRFVHANSLRRHIRLAHSDKFDYAEPMECPMCKQVFAKSSIKAHMATHSMDTQHDCNICNKSFSTKWNLKIHLWVHANRTAKPFKCEHCPKAFVREVDFKNHMNAHKQIKPYTCEYCGCKFIRKYNYMRHRREHHGNKKFTCDLCKKSFHRHYYLIEHRRIHTGERPFQCTICGKSSTTKTNHNKHLKIHHSRDPFTVET